MLLINDGISSLSGGEREHRAMFTDSCVMVYLLHFVLSSSTLAVYLLLTRCRFRK